MRKFVITGATSFLGRYVINELVKDDCIIYAYVRENSSNLSLIPRSNKVHFCYGDLSTMEESLLSVQQADAFLHFAWDGSGDKGRQQDDIQEMNANYALTALKLAMRMGCKKFIFPGSQAEYGICHEIISEDTVAMPVSPYGKAKLRFAREAMQLCCNQPIQFVHLRIFSVYGYGDRSMTLTDACMRKFLAGEHMTLGPCKQRWNYLYICDFAKIVRAILYADGCSGVYNVASDDTRTLKCFVEEMYNLAGKKGSFDFSGEVEKPEGIPDLDPDIKKLLTIVPDFTFTPFSVGVVETMKRIQREREE